MNLRKKAKLRSLQDPKVLKLLDFLRERNPKEYSTKNINLSFHSLIYMSSADNFRYLIPERIFKELTEDAKEALPNLKHYWLFADRKENFGIVNKFIENEDLKQTKTHVKPRSWMRYKKSKIWSMKKFKKEMGVDIVWQAHSHPTGKEKLHNIDKRILKYLSNGVMIIIIPEIEEKNQKPHMVGWYYDKRYTKKPIIEKMVFEIISE
ncbi:MAG: hypothetical protein BAJALOKI2v1_430015 [Promethearchaeota archaeon]|nr:MAG: hypothetical protein BAJALOKI2v1_430015 [Candidatus Lokiarchaeota archaeon]